MQTADAAIIIVVALIVFGPKKLPEVGKQFGQAMRELRKITDEVTGPVSPTDRSFLFVLLAALFLITLLNATR